MQINSTTTGRKLVLHVPWDSTYGCEWTDEGINVEVDIRTLLQTILPMACLRETTCCASRFACEEETAPTMVRQALPPVEEPRLMTERDIQEIDFVWEGDELVPREALL